MLMYQCDECGRVAAIGCIAGQEYAWSRIGFATVATRDRGPLDLCEQCRLTIHAEECAGAGADAWRHVAPAALNHRRQRPGSRHGNASAGRPPFYRRFFPSPHRS